MTTSAFVFPPVEYLFLRDDQPAPETWKTISDFTRQWNASHNSRFSNAMDDEWSLVLPKGIDDEEMPVLDQALAELQASADIVWFKAVVDLRQPADYETAPFVEIVGETFPEKLTANWKQATGSAWNCKHCGTLHSFFLPITDQLVINESVLKDPSGGDLITLPNGAMLISKRIDDLFTSHGVRGYTKIEVVSQQTGRTSNSLFLMQADKAILDPCSIHTPREEDNVCPDCGTIRGGILGHFHVRQEWLAGDEIFSRNALRLASINVSNRVYSLLKKEKIAGLLPAFGIFACSHGNE